jgi:hypothetical protein
VIPVMVLLRKETWKQRIKIVIGATVVGFAVYFVTNPYVLINAMVAPEILRSNLSNSTAMYGKRGLGGLGNAMTLLLAATSPLLFLAVFPGLTWLTFRLRRDHPFMWILIAPAACVFIQFVLLAENKPGEYARFAIFPAIVLAIAAAAGLQAFDRYRIRLVVAGILVVVTWIWGAPYIRGFLADAGPNNTRRVMAEALAGESDELRLIAEPAPYSCPPVNVLTRRIVLVDPAMPGDGTLQAVDRIGKLVDTPISWANKPFTWVHVAH